METVDGCSSPRRHRYLAVPLAMVTLLSSAGGVAAISPCVPLSYVVTYSSPLCNATLLAHSGPLPLDSVWWPAWWKGPTNLTTGEGFERASDYVNVSATSQDQVTVLDRDGNRNLTEGDILEVWSPGGCGGNLVLYLGPNTTAFNGQLTLRLEQGYTSSCGTGGADPIVPIVIGALFAASVAIPTAVFLLLWRRRSRG